MTRPIKFRAWDGEWMNKFAIYIDGAGMLPYPPKPAEGRPFRVLMQFTGLHDKNGKEIWEGDVVKHDYAKGEDFKANGIMVVGNETPDGQKICGLEMFDPLCSTTYSFDMSNEKQDDVEVIGNIYENPELIK